MSGTVLEQKRDRKEDRTKDTETTTNSGSQSLDTLLSPPNSREKIKESFANTRSALGNAVQKEQELGAKLRQSLLTGLSNLVSTVVDIPLGATAHLVGNVKNLIEKRIKNPTILKQDAIKYGAVPLASASAITAAITFPGVAIPIAGAVGIATAGATAIAGLGYGLYKAGSIAKDVISNQLNHYRLDKIAKLNNKSLERNIKEINRLVSAELKEQATTSITNYHKMCSNLINKISGELHTGLSAEISTKDLSAYSELKKTTQDEIVKYFKAIDLISKKFERFGSDATELLKTLQENGYEEVLKILDELKDANTLDKGIKILKKFGEMFDKLEDIAAFAGIEGVEILGADIDEKDTAFDVLVKKINKRLGELTGEQVVSEVVKESKVAEASSSGKVEQARDDVDELVTTTDTKQETQTKLSELRKVLDSYHDENDAYGLTAIGSLIIGEFAIYPQHSEHYNSASESVLSLNEYLKQNSDSINELTPNELQNLTQSITTLNEILEAIHDFQDDYIPNCFHDTIEAVERINNILGRKTDRNGTGSEEQKKTEVDIVSEASTLIEKDSSAQSSETKRDPQQQTRLKLEELTEVVSSFYDTHYNCGFKANNFFTHYINDPSFKEANSYVFHLLEYLEKYDDMLGLNEDELNQLNDAIESLAKLRDNIDTRKDGGKIIKTLSKIPETVKKINTLLGRETDNNGVDINPNINNQQVGDHLQITGERIPSNNWESINPSRGIIKINPDNIKEKNGIYTFNIGRDNTNAIITYNRTLSRQHLEVVVNPNEDSVSITQLGSNPSYIQKQDISGVNLGELEKNGTLNLTLSEKWNLELTRNPHYILESPGDGSLILVSLNYDLDFEDDQQALLKFNLDKTKSASSSSENETELVVEENEVETVATQINQNQELISAIDQLINKIKKEGDTKTIYRENSIQKLTKLKNTLEQQDGANILEIDELSDIRILDFFNSFNQEDANIETDNIGTLAYNLNSFLTDNIEARRSSDITSIKNIIKDTALSDIFAEAEPENNPTENLTTETEDYVNPVFTYDTTSSPVGNVEYATDTTPEASLDDPFSNFTFNVSSSTEQYYQGDTTETNQQAEIQKKK